MKIDYKEILKILIAVLTAIAGTLGVVSCMKPSTAGAPSHYLEMSLYLAPQSRMNSKISLKTYSMPESVVVPVQSPNSR